MEGPVDAVGALFLNRCIEDQLTVISNNQLILTEKALILADSIIIELMIDV